MEWMIFPLASISWAEELLPLLPALLIFFTSLVVLLLGLFESTRKEHFYLGVSLLGIVASWFSLLWVWRFQSVSLLEKGVLVDPLGLLFGFLISFALFLTILMSEGNSKIYGEQGSEYYGLILMAGSALFVMALSTHLVTLFVALETFSVGVYALVGIVPRDRRSKEGAIKYFVMGSLAAGILLYGIALMYGATGSFDLMDSAFQETSNRALLLGGLALLTIGLAFKVGAVPFHFWVPDSYEGAPTPITGYMATAVKMAAFAFFFRVAATLYGLPWLTSHWHIVLWVLAVLTMVVGSVLALWQENIKRLLAYSSIVHAGYMLIALYVLGKTQEVISGASLVFYLATYLVMTMGAFGCIALLGRERLTDYKGVGYSSPYVAGALTLFLIALAGVPPTAGFAGKFYVFYAAIEQGSYWLAGLGILASVISLWYYLRVVVYMYMYETEEREALLLPSWGVQSVLAISLILTISLGIFPKSYFQLAQKSVELFLK